MLQSSSEGAIRKDVWFYNRNFNWIAIKVYSRPRNVFLNNWALTHVGVDLYVLKRDTWLNVALIETSTNCRAFNREHIDLKQQPKTAATAPPRQPLQQALSEQRMMGEHETQQGADTAPLKSVQLPCCADGHQTERNKGLASAFPCRK